MEILVKESFFNDGEYLQLTKCGTRINITPYVLEKIKSHVAQIDESMKTGFHVLQIKLNPSSDVSVSRGFGGEPTLFITKNRQKIPLNCTEWDVLKTTNLKEPTVQSIFPYSWNHTEIKTKTAIAWVNEAGQEIGSWDCNLAEFFLQSNLAMPENA
ncbi:MAG: hypothetical protein GY705_16270, partial [Bacteroidetes bacterium]|nr:hypothetical protein [Bacteroidota bacterium]